MQLQREPSAPAVVPVALNNVAERAQVLLHRDQPVGPPGHPRRGPDRDDGSQQLWLLVGNVPHPRPVDGDQAVMAHLFTLQEASDHLHALLQPLHPQLLAGPSVAGDDLVERLAAAQGRPDASREHLRECCDLLGHDRRVVALSWSTDATELEARGGHGPPRAMTTRSRSGPAGSTRVEVVGAHGHVEAGLLRRLHIGEQLSRRAICSWEAWNPILASSLCPGRLVVVPGSRKSGHGLLRSDGLLRCVRMG